MPRVAFCPACGRPRVEDLRFCPSCAYDYDELAGNELPDDVLRRQVARHAKARVAVGCRTRIGSLIGALVGLYLGAVIGEQLVSPPSALLTLFLVLIGLIAGGWLGGWLVLGSIASNDKD